MMNKRWFNPNDIKYKITIPLNDLQGYVLPHASTTYTGHIISHSLRFKPLKQFNHVIILYYPSQNSPNVGSYYHEYYVPWKSLQYAIQHFWKIKRDIKFAGINIRDNPNIPTYNLRDTLIVVSADFSHGYPLQEAIPIENCSAHAIMQRYLPSQSILTCTTVIDTIQTFQFLYSLIPKNWMCQWIGRTRSPGKLGVGYLSFLLREAPRPRHKSPDGLFITAYDNQMRQRECLGQWFSSHQPWNRSEENIFKKKVMDKGQNESRLTGGKDKHIPVTHYTITYLYKDKQRKFIRGWHGIRTEAFYLPDVILENTFNNGKWIKPSDIYWPHNTTFSLSPTLKKLQTKSGSFSSKSKNLPHYELYSSQVFHGEL